MLSLTNIEKYYSEKEGLSKRNILKEYLQYKILEIIFTSKISQKLVFIGGTALKIVHGNTRFSEDLDFDNFGLTVQEFTSLAEQIRKGLELQGYKVEIKNVFKGAFRAYVKLPEVLFDNQISNLRNEKLVINVDTAAQGFDYVGEAKILNKFDVFTQINVASLPVLLSQKICAALGRSRPKGRDFFDIVFLLPQTSPDYKFLLKEFGVNNSQELKELLLSRTRELDFKELAKDVKPFLVNADDSKRVENFVAYIKSVSL